MKRTFSTSVCEPLRNARSPAVEISFACDCSIAGWKWTHSICILAQIPHFDGEEHLRMDLLIACRHVFHLNARHPMSKDALQELTPPVTSHGAAYQEVLSCETVSER